MHRGSGLQLGVKHCTSRMTALIQTRLGVANCYPIDLEWPGCEIS